MTQNNVIIMYSALVVQFCTFFNPYIRLHLPEIMKLHLNLLRVIYDILLVSFIRDVDSPQTRDMK